MKTRTYQPKSRRDVRPLESQLYKPSEGIGSREDGRVGYLVLYLLGAPIGLLLLLWVLLGNNLIGAG